MFNTRRKLVARLYDLGHVPTPWPDMDPPLLMMPPPPTHTLQWPSEAYWNALTTLFFKDLGKELESLRDLRIAFVNVKIKEFRLNYTQWYALKLEIIAKRTRVLPIDLRTGAKF